MPHSAPSGPVRALVIGAGSASELLHLPVLAGLRDRGELTLTAICDIASERAHSAQKKFGFSQACSDARTALDGNDIDAVYIFASAQLHFEYGLLALENGKHLFVEKPIAPTYAQAQTTSQTAHERGLIAVGGHNRRFRSAIVQARQQAGKEGWQFAEAVFHKPEAGKPPLFGAATWLSANGIHALDALIFAMGGLPDHLAALSGTIGSMEPNAFSALMRWPGGAQATFLCNNNAGARTEEYAFHAPGETYRITESGFIVSKGKSVSKTPADPQSASFMAEHVSFLRAVREGIDPPHSIANIAPSLFLAELIESGFTGAVRLPQAAPISRVRRMVATKSILIVKPEGLQGSLAKTLSDYRLASPEEISGPRPDVVAAILGRAAPPLSANLLDKLPNLSVVGVQGLSLSRHEPEVLLARGIALLNASSAYAGSVAEFALALAILGRRRAFASHELMRAGGWGTVRSSGLRRAAQAARPTLRYIHLEPVFLHLWKKAAPRAGIEGVRVARDLKGATAGLIGWGANARAFAERLEQAGARVLVYSEHASDVPKAMRASLAEALAADIVSLHRGLTRETQHFLGAAELARLRPGSVLINVARGALIEPRALFARLKQGDIFACLDTYEDEPLPRSHPLRRLPNVFLTSHIAGGSPDMHIAAAEEVVAKVLAHLNGTEPETVSLERLRTMT